MQCQRTKYRPIADLLRILPVGPNCRYHQNQDLIDRVILEDLFFVRNTNGMAKGPKTAPITAQNKVFAPLLSAIDQSRIAHNIHIIEIIITPVILRLPTFYLNTHQYR